MSGRDEYPDTRPDGMRNVYLALYLIGAVLSGAGGNYIWMRNVGPEVLAPDRFTGTQGTALIERVERLENRIGTHEFTHPDKANQFDRRIATLEAQYVIILQNQQRILDRLERK